jgi:radical SAM protein with 4Fe4S-binding SPASM domain
MKRLGPRVRLENVEGRAVMRYLPCGDLQTPPPLELHPLLAAVLTWLDAGWAVDDLSAHLAERLRNPYAPIREIVGDARHCFRAHFRHEGADGFVEIGDPDEIVRLLADGTLYRTRDVVFRNDRAPFPLTVQWLVTRYCNRQCIYCYQGAFPGTRPRDAAITTERVREILAEAAQLGAFTFFPTGGEPLLRDDSYDLLVFALELGMTPVVLSKQFIPEKEVARLAAAGLREITLSVDSLEPAVAARMTGTRTFASGIGATVERLVRHGVRVTTKMVLTSENAATVPATVEGLRRLGAAHVEIDTYSPNLGRHSDHLSPSLEQMDRVSELVCRLGAEEGGPSVRFDRESRERKASRTDLGEDCIVCHNGITSLLFLPDGRVSRCDKYLPGNEMVVGDLCRQSVHEVWNGPAMHASLKPPRELYRGTLCEDCPEFDTCHERGRCFYDAYLIGGTLYGPQGDCPRLGKGSLLRTC